MTAIWWVTTISFVLCIGFVCGTIFYFLMDVLHSEDATRIDPLKIDKEE
ncbi:MAG: hypothetical protein K6T88_05670 [Bacillus sp. (in: Bacteria)]|nr:hypothetical protein [Bacillus sp. (in: firmicutes)]